ncbi:hypothetical protein QNH10_01365 [Sporosarcina thermotolerans]|nr:hypothetical protein [Sporosarcina thermotolerans]WHT48518.1 hypothetical protein QNH10_01365 [Sporosarcina thermotolerans]
MREVVIVEGVRTAVARRKGGFSEYRPDELAAVVLEELINRAKIDKNEVEDVILGCVTQLGEQGGNIARTAVDRRIPGPCPGHNYRPSMRFKPTSGTFRFTGNCCRGYGYRNCWRG